MDYGQQQPGMGGPRDAITRALMEVQMPQPVTDVPPVPDMPMPGGPPSGGAAPGAPPAQPGAPPMLPQLNAATPPGMQPGGMLAQPQPGMPPR